MHFYWEKHTLHFKQPSGTSRGVLRTKDSWFIIAENNDWQYPAIGECSIIEGLSPDPLERLESTLDDVCKRLTQNETIITAEFPSISFATEMLQADIRASGSKIFHPNSFTDGSGQIPINGLVWMGTPKFMLGQIRDKVANGFSCLKLKIGAIDFEQEIEILSWIRKEFSANDLEIRVDANGAFSTHDALEKLERLSAFDLHSIEQPIGLNQWQDMARLCAKSPLPVALDEELIGVKSIEQKQQLLSEIKPPYIILKPSLVGGLSQCDEWIALAEERNIGWWLTSALESNIGLNSIAQYAFDKKVTMPQGLGTGSLYTNNIDSPLYIQRQFLRMNPNHNWNLNALNL